MLGVVYHRVHLVATLLICCLFFFFGTNNYKVVRALDTMGDLSNGVKPGESEIIDSREQSAQIRMFKRMTFESQEYSSDNYTSQSSWASGNTRGAVSGQAERSSGSQT